MMIIIASTRLQTVSFCVSDCPRRRSERRDNIFDMTENNDSNCLRLYEVNERKQRFKN